MGIYDKISNPDTEYTPTTSGRTFLKMSRDYEDWSDSVGRNVRELGKRVSRNTSILPDSSDMMSRDYEDTKDRAGDLLHKAGKFIKRTAEDHPFLTAAGLTSLAAIGAGLGALKYYRSKKKDEEK